MALGKLGARGGFGSLGVLGSVGASAFADGQAPPNGFHWVFLTDDITGQRVTDDVTGQPVVDLSAN